MPDTSLLTSSTLADEMRAHTGLFTEKTFDWDAFPASRGIPDLSRAQLRYVGAGGSPKVGDPSTMKAQHFTFSLVNQPVGKFAASHAHEVVEHFFILQKIEKVKEWLVYDEWTLSEIAWKLGYSSVAHLSAQFKKTTGLTPSDFKKMGGKRKSIDSV